VKPNYQGNLITTYHGDARNMAELVDESVQCVVTSPPYWGLRKYAGEQELVWGGDEKCEHQWVEGIKKWHGDRGERAKLERKEVFDDTFQVEGTISNFCALCGAWKGSYGLEPTPEMYIEHTLIFLREIWRVLRKDGVVFWNIGDSYWGGKGKSGQQTPEYQTERFNTGKSLNRLQLGGPKITMPKDGKHPFIKPKDLSLIPFRVALAAQEDGWWVRSVIIWSKSNPMPESVSNRPTVSHEYILMLTKSGQPTFWTHRDGAGARKRPQADYRWLKLKSTAIRGLKTKGEQEVSGQEQYHGQDIDKVSQIEVVEEVAVEPSDWKKKITCPECAGEGVVQTWSGWYSYEKQCPTCAGKGETTLWRRINLWTGHDYYWDPEAVKMPPAESTVGRGKVVFGGAKGRNYFPDEDDPNYRGGDEQWGRTYEYDGGGRNIRSVWEFPTQPYPGAHFAVFPEKLPELCIRAATPEAGCCSECGAPWVRRSEVIGHQKTAAMEVAGCNQDGGYKGLDRKDYASASAQSPSDAKRRILESMSKIRKSTWHPTCECGASRVPSLVLDPFMGSGTTAQVSKQLGRRGIGYELSKEYCKLALERNRQMAFSF
jgi:DNA modification methylase